MQMSPFRHFSICARSNAFLTILLSVACFLPGALASAAPIQVRYKEGVVHGFLLLSSEDGAPLADGDWFQIAHGDRVTSRLVYHFKDGSLQDETTIFSQRITFRLLSYHLVQKGPAFPHPSDLAIDASTGQVTVHYTDNDGKEKEATEKMKLPPDLANGLVITLMKNVAADAQQVELSMVVAAPKPRLVKLAISAQGEDPFSLNSSSRKAKHYVLKVELGGVAGVVAPLVGKQPADSHLWILEGEAPTFVKSLVLSYMGGPMWRTELVAPTWPQPSASDSKTGDATKH
jgi:hypothetical protein